MQIQSSEKTCDLKAQYRLGKKIQAEIKESINRLSVKITEMESALFRLEISGDGKGQLSKDYSDKIAKAHTDLLALQSKFNASAGVLYKLIQEIAVAKNEDRLAALSGMTGRHSEWQKEQDALEADFVPALAIAKLAEIKMRPWDARWHQVPPAFGPRETNLSNSFVCEVQRLLKLESLDDTYLTPGQMIDRDKGRLQELQRPVALEDVEQELNAARMAARGEKET